MKSKNNMNNTIPKTIFIILFSVFNLSSQNHKVTGYTSNLKDSTKVLLRNVEMDKPFDTTYVINNTFRFDIKPINGYNLFFIRIDKLKGKRRDFLFIDNSNIEIDLRDKDFDSAIIRGGFMQNQKMEFLKQVNSDYRNLNDKIDFVKKNTNYEYSAYLLTEIKIRLKNEEVQSLFDGLDESIKESKYGKIISTYLKLSKDFTSGVETVDFMLKDVKGKNVNLHSFRGKYVFLDFWGSWCGPCRVKHPFYAEMYKKYKDQGFEIISVSLDKDVNKWKKAMEEDKINWISLIDTSSFNGDIALTYKIFSVPIGYLIDKEGKIIERVLNGQLNKNTLEALFK